MNNLPRTEEALTGYEATRAERDASWDAALSDAAVARCVAVDHEAATAVREAFYQDTQVFNSHDNCMMVDIVWLAELVQKN